MSDCDPMDCSPPGLQPSSVHGDSPGKSTRVGCHIFFHRIFPTQGSNPGLQHCRWILYLLSHQKSPIILEWVALPSPGDIPNPGIEPRFPTLQADSLLTESPGILQGILLNQGLLHCRRILH